MNNKKLVNVSLDNIVDESYARYAKYIIQDRALPDVRDGLKPVQRRILYAMDELGILFDRPYKKSARTVGEVIGKYHPHGDSSIYEAMVRMAQDWKSNVCLLDMHGNKGSIDGDGPAAMRYTEARLAKVASVMLDGLKKDTVKFVPNFDDSEKEPSILPSIFPNLLINGAQGIASGYATNIPPHNPNEVFDAMIYRIKHPNSKTKDLIKICPAPDFPTGGEIHGLNGCYEAAETGNGRFFIHATIIENKTNPKIDQLIVTSIPFDANKSNIIKEIDDIIYSNKISGMLEVRDESDSKGVSIVIDFKKDVNLENAKNYLYLKTNLRTSYTTNFVAIVNRAPVVLSIDKYFDAVIEHGLDVINKIDLYDLNKINARIEIVEGLIKCLDIIDEIIAIIRSSKNKQESKDKIIDRFLFTQNQAEAIVMMRLYRLTQTDIEDLKLELANLLAQKQEISDRINSLELRKTYLIKKLLEYKKEFGYKRKTVLFDEVQKIEINEDDMIERYDAYLALSLDGYIKSISKKSFESSNYQDIGLKSNDQLFYFGLINSHSKVNIVTSFGKIISIIGYKINNFKFKDVGEHLNKFVNVEPNEKVVACFISDENMDLANYQIILATKNNFIKKINLADCELNAKLIKQIKIMKLNTNDELVSASIIENDQNHLITTITHNGMGSMFSGYDVKLLGLNSSGTKIIKLKPNDYIVDLIITKTNAADVLLINDKAIKIFNLSELKLQKRAQTPVHLYLQTKKTIYTTKAFALGSKNAFYLLDENKNVKPFGLIDYKTSTIDSKPIKYEWDEMIIGATKDVFLSEEVFEDYKKATIFAKDLFIEEQVENDEEEIIDLLTKEDQNDK